MWLIDADEIAKSVNDVLADLMNGIEASFDMRIAIAFRISECFRNAKTVDAEPVVHGNWIRRPLEDECSECHNKYPHDYHLGSFASYCPMCGAVMENLGFTSFRKE